MNPNEREYARFYKILIATQSLKGVPAARRRTFIEFLLGLRNASGDGACWTACCPAHADTRPSLSAELLPCGKILVHCFRGCSFDDICRSAGISPSDMFDSLPSTAPIRPLKSNLRHVKAVEKADQRWAEMQAELQQAITPNQIEQLATRLKVTSQSLVVMEIGWSVKDKAWTFPEYNGHEEICGIVRRYADDQKKAMPGAKRGLYLPRGWKEQSGKLYICEGQSDTAAAIMKGHRAIGRPNKEAGLSHLVQVLRDFPDDIIVVKDNDAETADAVTNCIVKKLSNALQRKINIYSPPEGFKDLRAFLTKGS